MIFLPFVPGAVCFVKKTRRKNILCEKDGDKSARFDIKKKQYSGEKIFCVKKMVIKVPDLI
jgi:hypothetical protein